MAWPKTNIPTADVDQVTDSPAVFRQHLKRLIDHVNTIINARGQHNGIAELDSAGRIPTSQLRAGGNYLLVAGGTMAGPLSLSREPTSDLEAAPKRYVDAIGGTAVAWGHFTQSSRHTLNAGFNVSSINDEGAGRTSVQFAQALVNTNYVVVIGGGQNTETYAYVDAYHAANFFITVRELYGASGATGAVKDGQHSFAVYA